MEYKNIFPFRNIKMAQLIKSFLVEVKDLFYPTGT